MHLSAWYESTHEAYGTFFMWFGEHVKAWLFHFSGGWTEIFVSWIKNSSIPLSPGNAPSPELPQCRFKFLSTFVPLPDNKEWAQTCNNGTQMFQEQVGLWERQYFSSPLSHVWRGNNTALCCSFAAERSWTQQCVIIPLEKKCTEEGVSHRPSGAFEGRSHRPYFGEPDESPAGCGEHAARWLLFSWNIKFEWLINEISLNTQTLFK